MDKMTGHLAEEPWEMSQKKFQSSPPHGFRYEPTLPYEADAHTKVIRVGPKFFNLPLDGRRAVIFHEMAHGIEDEAVKDSEFYRLVQEEEMFGPTDQKTGRILQGINGQYKPGENLVEAYVALLEDPKWLKKNYPVAYDYVVKLAILKGKPVPPEVLKDYPELVNKGHLSEEKQPWKMSPEERRKMQYPLKVPDEDTVYIFRKTGRDEVDSVLSGKESGAFWSSKDEVLTGYTIIAKSNKRYIRWALVMEHKEKLGRTVVSETGKMTTVWEKNPDFKEPPSIYNNHFQEVGEGRLLKDIVAILDENNAVIYMESDLVEKSGHLKA